MCSLRFAGGAELLKDGGLLMAEVQTPDSGCSDDIQVNISKIIAHTLCCGHSNFLFVASSGGELTISRCIS